MRGRLPEVICDTSFLMRMAAGRIRNVDGAGVDVGQIVYVVPEAVVSELERLTKSPAKRHDAAGALRLAGEMRRIKMPGGYADRAILDHVRERGGFVATIDRKLKADVKSAGGHIVSLHDDCIVLEPGPSGAVGKT